MPITKENLSKAIEELRKTIPKRKLKQSVDVVVKLRDIDLKKPDKRINLTMELPNAVGKPVKVCVIADGDLAVRSKRAEADLIIGREDLEKFGRDKKAARKLLRGYDSFIAEAPLMPLVGKTLGQILGPRGKMPTPIQANAPVEDIITRNRRLVKLVSKEQPVLHCRVATEDMPDEKLAENIQAVVSGIEEKLERGDKNIKTILIKPTMGPPVKISM